MDGRAWWITARGVGKSQTGLTEPMNRYIWPACTEDGVLP